jgi:hypothetical protein
VLRTKLSHVPISLLRLHQSIRPWPKFTLWLFRYMILFWWEAISTSPIPQAGGRPLVGCPRLLIQYIRSYPPYRRPFLPPKHEDAPCLCDMDRHITAWFVQCCHLACDWGNRRRFRFGVICRLYIGGGVIRSMIYTEWCYSHHEASCSRFLFLRR